MKGLVMATIKVTLREAQQEVLDNLVKSGRFASNDEAVNELLQAGADALEENDTFFTVAERAEIEARLSRNGPRIPAADVRRRLEIFMAERQKAAKRGP
jgi:Arc/MetJ-type ribon-helix-helix transcriptional regulator